MNDIPVGEVVLDEEGNRWREDATNAHTDRFRAFVRHEIIPKAKERNGQLLDTLCRTMNLIADEDDFLDSLASESAESNLEWIGGDGETRSMAVACFPLSVRLHVRCSVAW